MNETIVELLVLAGAALGVGLLVLLNMVVGGVKWFRLSSPEQAYAYLRRDVMGFQPSKVSVLASEGKAALVFEVEAARLGLVQAMGDKAVVRALSPAEIKSVQAQGPELVLALKDYTFQTVKLVMASPEQAKRWRERIVQFQSRHDTSQAEEVEHATTA